MVVLKGIPSVLTPELLYALAKMGHGDELGKRHVNNPIRFPDYTNAETCVQAKKKRKAQQDSDFSLLLHSKRVLFTVFVERIQPSFL